MQTRTIANNTRLTILLSAGLLMAALTATANAASGNGADGWRKLQDRQNGGQAEQSVRTPERVASANQYAAQVIAANPANYSVR